MPAPTSSVEAFISRWEAAGGSERANCELFLNELCALLELPQPDPARDDTRDNAYVFERRVIFRHGDGSESNRPPFLKKKVRERSCIWLSPSLAGPE